MGALDFIQWGRYRPSPGGFVHASLITPSAAPFGRQCFRTPADFNDTIFNSFARGGGVIAGHWRSLCRRWLGAVEGRGVGGAVLSYGLCPQHLFVSETWRKEPDRQSSAYREDQTISQPYMVGRMPGLPLLRESGSGGGYRVVTRRRCFAPWVLSGLMERIKTRPWSRERLAAGYDAEVLWTDGSAKGPKAPLTV